jgi:uncharacterized protein (TIRG00374 family)
LTAYILWKSHPRAVLAAAADADWRPIATAVVLVLFDRALMAYRWVVLLCTIDAANRPPLGDVLRIFFLSTFVGTFLPASVGGDAVRAYSIAKLKVPGGDAVASVFMDRMLGVASIVLLGVAALPFVPDLATDRIVLAGLLVAAIACGITLWLVFSVRAARAAQRVLVLLPVAAVQRAAIGIVDAIQRYATSHRELVLVLGASVAVQVLRVVQAYLLGRALDIATPLAFYFAFVPLILLVMLLPVTINGLGTSQAAFVWFFARAGVAAADAFALSILFVALGIVGNLPGGVLYALEGLSVRRAGRA